jgi:hypothetical protein
MTPRARIAIVAAAVVALVVAFVIASGSDETSKEQDRTTAGATPAATTGSATAPAATPADTTPATTPAPAAPAIPTVVVVDAKPKGGVKRLTFTKGDRIRFRVRSDTADEIHVHGYDVHQDVPQGGTVTFSIPATIEGRFVVELEGQGEQIAELEVNPS